MTDRPPDSPALNAFRAELRKLKSPLTFGMAPAFETFERLVVEQSRQIARLDARCRDLEAEISAQAERINGLEPPGYHFERAPDGTLLPPPGRVIVNRELGDLPPGNTLEGAEFSR